MSIDRSIIEPPSHVGLDHVVDKCAEIAVVKRLHNVVGFIELKQQQQQQRLTPSLNTMPPVIRVHQGLQEGVCVKELHFDRVGYKSSMNS